jgi:hypothetical protein
MATRADLARPVSDSHEGSHCRRHLGQFDLHRYGASSAPHTRRRLLRPVGLCRDRQSIDATLPSIASARPDHRRCQMSPYRAPLTDYAFSGALDYQNLSVCTSPAVAHRWIAVYDSRMTPHCSSRPGLSTRPIGLHGAAPGGITLTTVVVTFNLFDRNNGGAFSAKSTTQSTRSASRWQDRASPPPSAPTL